MSITFGKRGSCTLPATRTVEGYSPKDGLAHGELDVVFHSCEAHHQEAREQWLRGLTAYTVAQSPKPPRICGQFTDFTDNGSTAA